MESKLISSCEKLYQQNVLNDDNLANCKKELETPKSKEHLNELYITEKNIFNEHRDNKNKTIDDFLNNLNIIKNNYDNINNVTKKKLNKNLHKIKKEIEKLIVNTYKNDESHNYNKLLENYNDINQNNKKIDTYEVETLTLNERFNLLTYNLNNNNYNVEIIITTIAIILLIKLIYF